MALVRKTQKLKEEISSKLNSLQKKAANRRVTNLGIPGAELAYRIAGAEGVFYTKAQRELLNNLHDLPGNYVTDEIKIEIVFLEPNENKEEYNLGNMGLGDPHRYWGHTHFASERPNNAAQQRAKAQAGNPKIRLPLRFTTEFNFYSGQVFFQLDANIHGSHHCNVFVLSKELAQQIRDSNQRMYKKLRHDDLPEITDLIERLTTEYNEFNAEYQQTHKTRTYIFNTLWPSIRSLNAAVKHFPGITEYIEEETKERLYRKTERNVTPGQDHLAPPQEVMVATAKHKLLGDDDD